MDDIARALSDEFSRPQSTLIRIARRAIDEVRDELRVGQEDGEDVALKVLWYARHELNRSQRPFPSAVLNATGIIVHTGLGRSRLSEAATRAVEQAARQSCALEVDIESGERGRRDAVVADLLREITGCEDATVCNNGAGATLLVLSALCAGREAICARGELVEIGGGFRMPDVMQQSGAILREVGCTNKTRLADYEAAINEATGVLLKVHPSNYRIEGFVEEVGLPDLVELGQQRGVAVVEDLGSGLLLDLSAWGLGDEPTVGQRVSSGADAIIFSGDKLLGGPQCGLICGRSQTIERVRRHPLMRALRADKLTLAALDATLRAYRDSSDNWAQARREIPTLAAITAPLDEVKNRAKRLQRLLRRAPANLPAAIELRPSSSQAGAGSLPTRTLPSWSVVIRPHSMAVNELARQLRVGHNESTVANQAVVGVWGRVRDDALWLDCRTLHDDEISLCAARILSVLSAAEA